jgi:hypothetical protein
MLNPSSATPLSFNDALKQQGQSADASMQQNPIMGHGAEMAGGLTSPIFNGISSGVSSVLGSLPRYLKYGLQGGTMGMATGLTSARDQSGGLPTGQDVQSSMEKQGGIGSALGVAIPGATELGIKAINLLRGAPQILDSAGNAIGDVTQSAIQRITKALGRDDLSTPGTAQTVLSNLGPQGVLGDVGANTSLAVERAASRPGAPLTAVSKFAAARQAGAPERVAGSITDNLADPNFYEMIDALRTQRNTIAAPLRQQALDESAGVPVKSDLVQRLQGTPEFQSAMATGKSIARMEAARTGKEIPQTEQWFHGDSFDDPDIESRTVPTLRMLDAAKQGYNELLKPYRNPFTGALENLPPKGVEIAKTADALTQELRANSDTYGQYLDNWADPSQSMQAVKTGKNFLTMKPQEASRIWDGMSDSEKQFAKVGFAKAQVDKVGDVSKGGNPAGRLLATPNQTSVAQMIYGDDFPAFQQDMQNEATFAQNNSNWLRGSRTGIRTNPEEDEEGAGGSLIGAAGHAVSGNWKGAATHAVGPAIERAKNMIIGMFGPGEAVSTEMTNRLLSQDPAVQSETLDLVNKMAAARAQRIAMPSDLAAKSISSIPGILAPEQRARMNLQMPEAQ